MGSNAYQKVLTASIGDYPEALRSDLLLSRGQRGLGGHIRAHQGSGLTRDYSLLVGRQDPNREPRRRGVDTSLPSGVGVVVEIEAEPRAAVHDVPPGLHVSLADPAREHQAIEPAKCSRQRADLSDDSVYKQVGGLLGARIVGLTKSAHVGANPRYAEQA